MAANDIGFNISVTGVEASTKKVKNFQQTTTRELTTAENSVARSIGNMVKQYASLAIGIRTAQKALSSGIEFNKFIETQTAAFTVMMKSADKAKAQIKELYDFAIKSPLKFTDTVSASKQLLAYGFAAEELVPTMNRLGTVALATGNSLAEVNYVYGTLRAQGRAYSRDLMQFGTRGIPIYEELAKVLGVDVKMVQKLTSEGKVGFKEVEQAFINMSSAGGRFGGFIDEYMKNFEGKANKLSDIWAQSMGTLTSSLFDVMKTGLDSLIATLESSGMQTIFKDIGEDIGGVANALSKVMGVMVKLIPLLTTFLKLWVAFKALNLVTSVIGGIPAILNKMAEGLFVVTGALSGGITTSLVAFGATASSAFGNAVASVSLFGGALKGLMMANPWLAALLIAGTALTTIMFIYKKQGDTDRDSAFSHVRKGQLEKDMKPLDKNNAFTNSSYYSAGSNYGQNIPKDESIYYTKTIADVKRIAEEYNLTEDSVADSLIKIKALSDKVWDAYTGKIEGKKMAQEYNDELHTFVDNLNFADTFEAVGINMDDYIKDALTVDGKPEMYEKYLADYVEAHEFSLEEAEKYRKEMAGVGASIRIEPDLTYKKFKISENLPKVDQSMIDQMILAGANDDQITTLTEGTIKDRVKTLSAYIENLTARDAKARAENKINPISGKIDQNTGLLTWLLEQLSLAEEDLAKSGKGVEAVAKEIKDMGAWWLPQEASAGATISALDDIQLVADKALASAREQIDTRIKLAEENKANAMHNRSITTDTDVQLANAKLIAEYSKIIVDLKAEQAGIERDITTETDRQKGVIKFNEMTEGKAGYWDEMAGKATQGGMEGAMATGATALQGTEVGSMMAGADPLTGLILALAEMLMSIENVNKVLNPFSTIMEGMKSVIEPFVDSVLQPMVNMLEMAGEILGKVIAPFLSIIQVAYSLMYARMLPLIFVLQLVGAAFAWFNDEVIYPIGNALIDTINGVIHALNRIPFVSIKYIDRINKVGSVLENLASIVGYMKDSLKSTMDYFTKKLNSLADKEISSLQDLYEVGAISGSEYEDAMLEANSKRIPTDDLMVSQADKQIVTAKGMLERLKELALLQATMSANPNMTEQQISNLLQNASLTSESQEIMFARAVETAMNAYQGMTSIDAGKQLISLANLRDAIYSLKNAGGSSVTGGGSISGEEDNYSIIDFAGKVIKDTWSSVKDVGQKVGNAFEKLKFWDVGTPNITADHIAQVHKGEMIVPTTFAQAIRSGDLTLGGNKKEGSGQNVIVNVTVQGSVTSERDLANTIATQIYTNRSRGLLTV